MIPEFFAGIFDLLYVGSFQGRVVHFNERAIGCQHGHECEMTVEDISQLFLAVRHGLNGLKVGGDIFMGDQNSKRLADAGQVESRRAQQSPARRQRAGAITLLLKHGLFAH